MLTEAENFIEQNTQKLSENKYLCPLSGKKFKGPEFVKKHIFNKHMDKVEAVKKEVRCEGRGRHSPSLGRQPVCIYLAHACAPGVK